VVQLSFYYLDFFKNSFEIVIKKVKIKSEDLIAITCGKSLTIEPKWICVFELVRTNLLIEGKDVDNLFHLHFFSTENS
jgi:hypothetical protein